MSDVPTQPEAADAKDAAPGAAPGSPPVRLGDALIACGELTPEQLEAALRSQRQTKRKLGQVLVEDGLIARGVLVRTLAKTLGVPGVELRHGLIDPALIGPDGVMTDEQARELCALPMFKVHGTLTVAMAEPRSLPLVDRLRQITGCKIRPVLALEQNINEYASRYAGGDADVDAFLTQLVESDVSVVEREAVDEGPTTDLDRMVEGSPIINLVNVTLLTAVKDKASDIHIEPSSKGTRVRYRIDGVLRDLMKPPPGMHAAIVSRVKVIGKMDIAEKRLPQEGRVRIVAEGREIDLRVSSIPTLLGEKLVVRILDKSNLNVRMEQLGFRDVALGTFKKILDRPHGLVLVTGPTGSGKTTTLYSALDLLRSPERNIVTVEDPVEYQLDLVNQIQVQANIGMDFARALRSILRQDPDVIMVGEIRDTETARVATQAALTGHLVLATLHTNDAPGAVGRLLDMGIEPYLLSSALNGVVAQRLARTLCPHCETKYYPDAHVLDDAGLPDHRGKGFRHGEGCKQCHDSGFKGRCGVYEIMEVGGKLRRLIHHAAPAHELRDEMRSTGALSLREEGVRLALEGRTSLEEALRVTHQERDPGAPVAEAAPGAEPRRAA